MTCPKCGAKPKAIKTEPAVEGHARLLECQSHGQFWSLERLWKWVVKVAGNGRATAGQPLGNGPPTAIPVAEPLGNLEGGNSDQTLLRSDSDPNPKASLLSEPRARVKRKGRGDAIDYPPEFEAIWNGCVPHTGNKEAAFKQWLKCKPDPTLTIDVYLQWSKTDSWQRGYIPHLRKWLYEKGWANPPTDADMTGPRAGAVVSFAKQAEDSRSKRVLDERLRRRQEELTPKVPHDPRAEYVASIGGQK
jgi:hypothetical protein